jgi:hypothetical protein
LRGRKSECEYILNTSLQTGITVYWCFIIAEGFVGRVRHTVDGNGHGLSQDVSILALESGDLSKGVDLEVVGADTVGRSSGNKLNVEAVGLSDSEDSGGARVALIADSASVDVSRGAFRMPDVPPGSRSCRNP